MPISLNFMHFYNERKNLDWNKILTMAMWQYHGYILYFPYFLLIFMKVTCLLRNLYAGQEATVRTGHGTTDWFQIGKGVHQGCILSPCLFNLYAEYIVRNAGLEEAQAGIKIAGRNINNLRYARWHHPYNRKWRRTKERLDESERGEWKSWLKAQHSENYDHGIWSHQFQFIRSVVSDSLRPYEPQHIRPPCPSPTPRVQSNPCPFSQWHHSTISSSVAPFSSCPQSLPASGSFQMSQLFSSGGQSNGVSGSASVLPMNTQDWPPLGWTDWISL